ncbi:MAG: hypothetical protein AB8B81_08530 [Halioglobus sp.]
MKRMNNLFFQRARISLLLVVMPALFAACGSHHVVDNSRDITVKIVFDDAHCPVGVIPEKSIDVSKQADQRILWQAVDKKGNPVDERYEIFFDPFKGNPIRSRSHGSERSPRISADSPVDVEYKYSIRGEKCDGPALDPRFRLSL